MNDYTPSFLSAVAIVLAHEGGLVDNPADPGGITNFGISLASYPDLGADGIRNLTRDDAIAIYWRDWWQRYDYEALLGPIGAKVFDGAATMGNAAAVICLQRALRAAGQSIADDGVLGPETIGAMQGPPPAVIMAALRSELAAHYRLVAEARPQEAVFLTGWLNRAYS